MRNIDKVCGVSRRQGLVLVQGVVVFGEIGHKQIEVAIVVVIAAVDPHTGLGPPALAIGCPGRLTDFAEVPVAVVAQKHIGLAVVGNVNI